MKKNFTKTIPSKNISLLDNGTSIIVTIKSIKNPFLVILTIFGFFFTIPAIIFFKQGMSLEGFSIDVSTIYSMLLIGTVIMFTGIFFIFSKTFIVIDTIQTIVKRSLCGIGFGRKIQNNNIEKVSVEVKKVLFKGKARHDIVYIAIWDKNKNKQLKFAYDLSPEEHDFLCALFCEKFNLDFENPKIEPTKDFIFSEDQYPEDITIATYNDRTVVRVGYFRPYLLFTAFLFWPFSVIWNWTLIPIIFMVLDLHPGFFGLHTLVQVFLFIFIIPFVVIGVGLIILPFFLAFFCRKIIISNDYIMLRSEVLGVGFKKQIVISDINDITFLEIYSDSGERKISHIKIIGGNNTLSFGAFLSCDTLIWLLIFLRKKLINEVS